jgi:DNA-directed RNA polymerase specialized sigma24 family protein
MYGSFGQESASGGTIHTGEAKMAKTTSDLAVESVLHMGWLYPAAGIAKIICPDLVTKARVEEWDVQRFVREAIPRIPTFVRSHLRITEHRLEATCQNVILRMSSRRPDLFYDPAMGTLKDYFVAIVRVVDYETCRQERLDLHEGWDWEREDSKQRRPDAIADDRDLLEIARQWAEELSPNQRDAVVEKYFDYNAPRLSNGVSEQVIRVRRSHGIRNLRCRAQIAGLGPRRGKIVRGRLRRSRRAVRGRWRRCRGDRLPSEMPKATTCGAVNEGSLGSIGMSAQERAIEASNAHALRTLVDSLPEPLKARIEVLETVREVFEREFARRSRRRHSSAESGSTDARPSSQPATGLSVAA